MSLTDSQLARYDALARALVRHLRAVLPRDGFQEIEARPSDREPVLVVRIPAASPVVGDVLIHSDGTELTTFIGEHTHDHTGVYVFGKPDDTAAIEKAAASRAAWIRDLLADRIVIWSRRDANGRVKAGGTATAADDGTVKGLMARAMATEAWYWSGRRAL